MTLADRYPDLVPSDDEFTEALETIGPAYKEYVQSVSTPGMAIGLRSAAFIYTLCSRVGPRRADFGSGFTSYILRLFGDATSVDHDPEWLEKTATFLEGHGLSSDGVLPIDEFRPARFDLIVYDYAGGEDRDSRYGWVSDMLAEGGVIFYDDAHHPPHAFHMREACLERGYDLFALDTLTDQQYGRFGCVGIRP